MMNDDDNVGKDNAEDDNRGRWQQWQQQQQQQWRDDNEYDDKMTATGREFGLQSVGRMSRDNVNKDNRDYDDYAVTAAKGEDG